MISPALVTSDEVEHPYYALHIKDKRIMSAKTRHNIVNVPIKLPMVCPPKHYGEEVLGGYLLNDVKYAESLIVEKPAYSLRS